MTTASVIVLVGGWVVGWILAGRHHSLAAVLPPEEAVRVSVIVPARDEAERLPRLLARLALADPQPVEVLVIDDGSTDATALLARQAGARVIPSEPPDGWTGKAWACQRGADAASGDVLVFLDADTEPAPDALALLAAAAAHGALASVQPRHRVEGAYERLSAGPALVCVLGAGTGGPPRRRWWRRPMAFGPAIAVHRELYERIGGHAAVRAAIADDLALASAADRAGVPVRALVGDDRLSYRMYPEGVRSLVEGWSKNLATGAGATPPLRLLATVGWVTAALQAPLLALSGPVLLAVVVYAAFAVQVGVLLRRIGRFGDGWAAVYPALLVAFVVLFVRSVVLTVAGRRVPWRGRRVAVRA